MRIIKENACAVIIDFQEKLFPYIFENEKVANNTLKLINGLKILEVNMLVTEQYSKGLGKTINVLSNELIDFECIEKMSFSCCGSNEFCYALKSLDKKFVIIAGIESHVCVLQTVIDLIDKGYIPVLVSDCVSSRNENDKNIAIERMRNEGAIITTYESLLFELCVVSGNDVFKAISKIVK